MHKLKLKKQDSIFSVFGLGIKCRFPLKIFCETIIIISIQTSQFLCHGLLKKNVLGQKIVLKFLLFKR